MTGTCARRVLASCMCVCGEHAHVLACRVQYMHIHCNKYAVLKLQQLQRPMYLKLTVAVGQFYTGQRDTYAQTTTTLRVYQVPWRNCLESNAPKQLHHGWLPWVCVVAQLSQCHCLRPHSQKGVVRCRTSRFNCVQGKHDKHWW